MWEKIIWKKASILINWCQQLVLQLLAQSQLEVFIFPLLLCWLWSQPAHLYRSPLLDLDLGQKHKLSFQVAIFLHTQGPIKWESILPPTLPLPFSFSLPFALPFSLPFSFPLQFPLSLSFIFSFTFLSSSHSHSFLFLYNCFLVTKDLS